MVNGIQKVLVMDSYGDAQVAKVVGYNANRWGPGELEVSIVVTLPQYPEKKPTERPHAVQSIWSVGDRVRASCSKNTGTITEARWGETSRREIRVQWDEPNFARYGSAEYSWYDALDKFEWLGPPDPDWKHRPEVKTWFATVVYPNGCMPCITGMGRLHRHTTPIYNGT